VGERVIPAGGAMSRAATTAAGRPAADVVRQPDLKGGHADGKVRHPIGKAGIRSRRDAQRANRRNRSDPLRIPRIDRMTL